MKCDEFGTLTLPVKSFWTPGGPDRYKVPNLNYSVDSNKERKTSAACESTRSQITRLTADANIRKKKKVLGCVMLKKTPQTTFISFTDQKNSEGRKKS